MRKRLLSLALVMALSLGLTPLSALAADGSDLSDHGEKVLALLPDDPRPTVTTPADDELTRFTLSLIEGKTTDLEKAKAIFDWVSQNAKSDNEAFIYSKSKHIDLTEEDRKIKLEYYLSSFGAIYYGDGYCSLYEWMYRAAGLPVARIRGRYGSDWLYQWTAVFADGRWIFINWREWDKAPDNYVPVSCWYYSDVFCFEPWVMEYTDGTIVYDGIWSVCCDLEEVVIPDGFTEIPRGAFTSCPSLTRLTIPNSVTKICDGAFSKWDGFPNLTHLTIPDSVTEIGRDAFYGCAGLTSITIPASVTSIGAGAFAYCKNLTSVTFLDGANTTPELLSSHVFSDCPSLTTVTMPAGVRLSTTEFYGTPLTVYYGGTEEQFKEAYTHKLGIPGTRGYGTVLMLETATVHYNSYIPKTEAEVMGTEPAPAISAPTAYASNQRVLACGNAVKLRCYALKDANGNPTNYVKLRDVAFVLNGTAVQFNVGWDGCVNIETGKGYTPNGSEMKPPFSGNRAYETATAETRINGSPAALDAIVLKDDAGGAYTYYKLRDLGAALGFRVDWTAERGIFIETK